MYHPVQKSILTSQASVAYTLQLRKSARVTQKHRFHVAPVTVTCLRRRIKHLYAEGVTRNAAYRVAPATLSLVFAPSRKLSINEILIPLIETTQNTHFDLIFGKNRIWDISACDYFA